MLHKPLLRLSAFCFLFILFSFHSSFAQNKRASSSANNNCGCQVFIENVGPQTSGFLEVVACGSISSDQQCFPGSYKESIPFFPWISGEQQGFFDVSDPEGSVSFRLEGAQAKNVRAKVRLLCENGTSRAFFLSEDAPYGVSFQGCQPQIECPEMTLDIVPNFRTMQLEAVVAGGFGNYQINWAIRETGTQDYLFYNGTSSIPIPCGVWDLSFRVTDLCSSCDYDHIEWARGYRLCDPDHDLDDGDRTATQDLDISLYPNPATKHVIVKHTADSKTQLSLKIYDSKGALYDIAKGLTFQNQLKIDVSRYPQGTYFVKLVDAEKILHSEKLVIQK